MSTTISRRVEGAGLSRQDFQIPGSTDSAGESSLLRYLSLKWPSLNLVTSGIDLRSSKPTRNYACRIICAYMVRPIYANMESYFWAHRILLPGKTLTKVFGFIRLVPYLETRSLK